MAKAIRNVGGYMDYTTLMNYGAMGVCLAYFIYKDNTTMKDFRNSLDSLKEAIQIIKTEIEVKNKEGEK
jgi:hypothetical protein